MGSIRGGEYEEEFMSLFKIGMKNSLEQNLEMFGDTIMDDAVRISGGDSLLIPGNNNNGTLLGSFKRPFDERASGRNLRARTSLMSTPTKSSHSSSYGTSSFAQTPSTTGRATVVKMELNEDDLLSRKERVQILVRPINTEFVCSKANIAKSPVLASYVVEHAGQQPYIMNPALKDTDPGDFGSVIEYLRTNEYAPILIEAPANRSDSRKYVLDGVACDDDFLDAVQQCGRLHVVAKKFQMPSMVDYIFKRLTEVRYSNSVIKNAVFLQLTNIVFTGTSATTTGGHGEEENQEDALESRLIGKIVENLEKITT
jgi:hypothetical protein